MKGSGEQSIADLISEKKKKKVLSGLVLLNRFKTKHAAQTRENARRALSQFWSFKIGGTTFLNYIKFVDPRILTP